VGNSTVIELPRQKLTEELGDLLWYFTNLCTALDITLEEVMSTNLAKLHQRHPHGFVARYASDSHLLEQQSAT
jgi:NTP pyrophosphatase (non-canonical NTP hydrolase)